jgi:hypothetical protein
VSEPESAIEAIALEIDDRAETVADVERSTAEAATVFARSGQAFAVVDSDGFDFRLGPTIGSAALRTPDVTPASRGRDWVRFSPAGLDEYALDRALAWFDAAWRRAASG